MQFPIVQKRCIFLSTFLPSRISFSATFAVVVFHFEKCILNEFCLDLATLFQSDLSISYMSTGPVTKSCDGLGKNYVALFSI